MNRNLLIIAAASLALIVAAPVQSKDQTLRLPVQTQNGSRCVSTLSQSSRMTDGRLAHLPYAESKTPCARVPQGPGADDKLITEIPEGDTRTMVR